MAKGNRPSEDDLIARFFAPIAGEGGLALLDDAALLSLPEGHELVLTTDAVVAGVHFFADDPAPAIAAKALGVNLSDLAAKGAEPLGFLLTLALPGDWTESWLAGFTAGLTGEAQRAGCPLLGGDTVRTPGPLTIAITAFGSVPAGRMVLRTTAKPRDLIAVTGTIGDAALGLLLRHEPQGSLAQALGAEACADLVDRYVHPQPRLALAEAVRTHARAAMDISDGLVGDLTKLLAASGVTGHVDLDKVPVSQAAQAAFAVDPALRDVAVTGGDDYEILLTAPLAAMEELARIAGRRGVRLTVVGGVKEGTAPPRFTQGGWAKSFPHGSFQHF